MDAILDQIDRALRAKKLSDAAASKLAVGHPSLIKNLRMPRDGEKRYNFPALQKLAEVLDLELYFGPKREGSGLPSITVNAEEFAPIPERSARLAAGFGEINDDDCVVGHLVFRKDWLTRQGIMPEKAILAHASGNSMAPCIMDGDILLIDTRGSDEEIPIRAIKPGRALPIYAFQVDGEARVKRIARPSADQLLILSDNPDCPPELMKITHRHALNIIGRVRWWGHTVED